MKKKILILAILSLVLMPISGCGKKNNNLSNEINNLNNKTTEESQNNLENKEAKNDSKENTYLGIVYLNPENKNATCNEELASANVNSYGTPTGIDSGCMKWYVYKEEGDNYKAILDHNTSLVSWNIEGEHGGKNLPLKSSNLQPLLNELSKKWINTNSFVSNIGIISGQEIAEIIGNTSWKEAEDSIEYLYDSDAVISKYAWLYDNIRDCEKYGCTKTDNEKYINVADNHKYSMDGYWTSTTVTNSTSYVWVIDRGAFRCYNARSLNIGLRPVITIPKSAVK